MAPAETKKDSTSLSAQIDWKNAAKVFLPIAAAVFVLIFIFLEKKRRAARWRKALKRQREVAVTARRRGCRTLDFTGGW